MHEEFRRKIAVVVTSFQKEKRENKKGYIIGEK